MKIGYLGPKGTFSYEACKEYCQNEEEMIEYKTIPDTIIALENGEIDECIVPIENSLQGCVTDAIDTLIQNENIYVKKEILKSINQNIMSNKKCELNEIEVLYSHPQALAQCKNYINNNLKNAKIVAVDSTAYAAKKASEEKGKIVSCIGNISCVDEYKLNLISEKIQDNIENKTKFWILSKEKKYQKDISKMSMIFSVKDKPGALYRVLEIFNKYNLNLTKIESRPAKTVMGEYYFLIDVSIEESRNEEQAISEIMNNGIFIRILGKY